MAIAANDDQYVAVAKGGSCRRKLDAAGQQVCLLADMGHGVFDKIDKCLANTLALFIEHALQLDGAEQAAAHHPIASDPNGATLNPHRVAVTKALKKLAVGGVDQTNTGPRKH